MNKFNELRCKYPDRIPLIIQKSDIPLNKHKYLIPYDMYVSEFLRYVCKNTDTDHNKSIILFIEEKLPTPNSQFKKYLKNEIIKVSILYNNTFG